jgi:hypothetical protein
VIERTEQRLTGAWHYTNLFHGISISVSFKTI